MSLHYLKTCNSSADNFKKYSISMGRHLSLRNGQGILVSGYPVFDCCQLITTLMCNMSVMSVCRAPKHWLVCLCCGRTDGRAVYGHEYTKLSGMGRFTYPWCSAGARELRYKRAVFDKGYTPKCTEEIFVVHEVLNARPLT